MSLQDSLFAGEVENDVQNFIETEVAAKRVLVFPPVNNYRRFLIHQLVQDKYENLHTFSIGQGCSRRTVVCYKADFNKDSKLNAKALTIDSTKLSSDSTMGVETNGTRRSSSTSPEHARQRDTKTAARSIEIYRPPAARRSNVKATESTTPPQPHDDGITESSFSPTATSSNKNSRQKRPDRAVYVPRHRRSSDSAPPTTPSSSGQSPMTKVPPRDNSDKTPSKNAVVDHQQSDESRAAEKTKRKLAEMEPSSPVESECKKEAVISECEKPPVEIVEEEEEEEVPVVRQEPKDSKFIKGNYVSNVLIISEKPKPEESSSAKKATTTHTPVPVVPVTPPEKRVKKVERPKSKPAVPTESPPSKITPGECDWESLFDENGEYLGPDEIEELTLAVGEVLIEKPKNDYKPFTKPTQVSSDELAHVVEIYNFPSDFKTSDLAAVFSPFRNGGFELKWVDDTHCLGVFSSPLVAAEVLASDHPFVKTRPLNEATALSKTKARKSAEFLQPYRSRPETCAALARRLVTGALGVKLATARQEREQEKIVLREAKERKRLANQQRDDAWEGIIPKK